MANKKISLEISCAECGTSFRLWIPEEALPEWEKGGRISCIRCGAEHSVRKGDGGFVVRGMRAPAPEAPKAAPPPSAEAPVYAPAPQPQQPAQAAYTGQDTVLFIEDDKLARKMAETTLKDMGIRLLTVKNSTEALRALKTENVKLIVTDLYLKDPSDPGSFLDGEDLLKKVLETGQSIPAIVTTGKDIIDDLVLDPKWFDLKVKGFIQKGNPFWIEELKTKIKEVLYKD